MLNAELRNEIISNVVLDNNLCTNTSDNLSLKIPVVQLNEDNGKHCNFCLYYKK